MVLLYYNKLFLGSVLIFYQTLHMCTLCHTLACAGGDCIGLLSRTMCCSCLSFLYAAGISVILLQEKSSRMRGRSASSAGTHKFIKNKHKGKEGKKIVLWVFWNSMQHNHWSRNGDNCAEPRWHSGKSLNVAFVAIPLKNVNITAHMSQCHPCE